MVMMFEMDNVSYVMCPDMSNCNEFWYVNGSSNSFVKIIMILIREVSMDQITEIFVEVVQWGAQ